MATAAASRRDRRNRVTLPPRRGQIKARIFESMVRTASAAASKAGALLLLGSNKPISAGSTPVDNSPPLSSYGSDAALSSLP